MPVNYIPSTSTTQMIYNYTYKKNASNGFFPLNYPSSRPLQIYRNQGVHQNVKQLYTEPCNTNCSTTKSIGSLTKMISQDVQKDQTICCPNTQGPVGSKNGTIMSFSGKAKIRSAVQPKNNSYYSDNYSFLRSRGNTFNAKDKFRDIPNIDYKDPNNSTYYELQEGPEQCVNIKTTYKPNNKNFATQGAVSCDTRILKLKQDTIQKNNLSFVNPFKTVLYYSEDPVYFEKNKVDTCNIKCTTNIGNTPQRQAALFGPS